jgi:hypothetical protein
MSYFGGVPTSALAGVVALAALGTAPHVRARAPAPSRQPVALSIRIDAAPYRRRLRDETCTSACRALETKLAESVRAMLQRSYGFFDWGASGASDTVVMRWIDRPPPEIPGSLLAFQIAGPVRRMRQPVVSFEFERYSDFSRREAMPARWNPDSLRKEWMDRLSTTLLAPDVLVTVFGRIPIVASATFPRPGLAEIAVRPEDVAPSADARPVFSVHATITDTSTNTADDAELILHKCKTTITRSGYACEVLLAEYASDRVTGQALIALLGRAIIAVRSVHIVEFVSPGRQSRFSGILPAEGLP